MKEELQVKLRAKHDQLRQAEAKLVVLRDEAAKSIGAVEAQVRKVEVIYTKTSDIEDEIVHSSWQVDEILCIRRANVTPKPLPFWVKSTPCNYTYNMLHVH